MKSKIRFEASSSRLLLLVALIALTLPAVIWSNVSGQGRRRPIVQPISVKQGDGLQFRLSEGTEENQRQQPITAAPVSPLSDDATNNLLKRLPAMKAEADDQKDFAMRDRSLPAPRTGQTINGTFPPADSATAPEQTSSGPLEVLRFAPEGEVALAPHLTVTFSQPMVAVTSVTDLAAAQVPAKLTPQPPGKWRWLGTKTLIFEPEGRFPMATNYSVEIPAGTKSATGGALAAAKRWTFATPPVQMKSSYPNDGPHVRNPIFFIEFDQRIDPAAMLKAIKLTAGANVWRLRLATNEEIESDANIRRRVKSAEAGRWLAFRAIAASNVNGGVNNEELLPAGTSFTVTINAGAPSAEGPRTTAAPQKFTFRTYDALQLTEARCGYGDGCRPLTPFQLNFNNPLDAKIFQQSQIKVAPAIEGMKVAIYGNTMNISGATKGRTAYTVTVDAALHDVFGQTLGRNEQRTFNVGSAEPFLSANGNGYVVLDPNGPPRFSVYTINQPSVKVRLYQVAPENWPAYASFLQARYQRPQTTVPPGELVKSQTVTINGQADEITETAIDLSPALKNGLGHVVMIIEPTIKRRDWEREIVLWVQATQIGLDAFTDATDLTAWASSLKDGKPLDGVEVSLTGADSARTRTDGLARFALPSGGGQKVLIARKGDDVAMLPENIYSWDQASSAWNKRNVSDALNWHVFDDRAMYRPGEEVHIKGWMRRIGGGKLGDVGLAGEVKTVSYVLHDSRGNEVTKGTLQVNALGGFDTAFKLPATMNLGHTNLTLTADGLSQSVPGQATNHSFQVQEFRRPEYEVKVMAGTGPHFIRGYAIATASANYYAGGVLSNAETNWQVTATPTNYTPPNRGDFIFGTWTPWWWGDRPGGQSTSQSFAGRTDAAGKHNLRIDFDSVSPVRATSITAQATVQDVNRQAIAGTTSFIVHPSELYVGIRSPRNFVQKGEPLVIESIVTDIDGKIIANREIRMHAVLIDWAQEGGEWKEREINPQECVVKSASDAVPCRFATKDGGRYRVTASVIDDRERRNESQMTLWVAGGKTEPQRDVAQEKVELIPDRKEYEAGQSAEILVQAPFFPAEGVVTLRRSGLVSTERFTMASASHTLKIPIKDEFTPNIHVQVDLVGAAARTDDAGNAKANLPKRPAFASGELNLTVPPLKRKLTVTATPRDKALEPGGETTVDVTLRDAAGKPVANGEVAVVVVDEAVLALSNYQLADPLNTFYSQRGADVNNYHLRQNVVLTKPTDLISQANQQGQQSVSFKASGNIAPGKPVPMAAMAGESKQKMDAVDMVTRTADREQQVAQPIRTRIDFNALATFAPALPTDTNGRASVKVKVPDNLTRYRVMAVAVAGEKQFGSGESAITARLPLMARPSAPRFLNFGDKFELPVVVQNQTDNPMEVDVVVRATNGQFASDAQPPKGGTLNAVGRRVTIPANDRIEVRFPATTLKPGTARFQIAAASGRWADSAEVSLPVWTPATTEAFATYGEIDAGAILQPVKAPSDAFKQFGGLEITTSSTQLQALTDAVIYLVNYPYDCAEQVSSRVLAIAALKDVLGAFDAKGLPPTDALIASVKNDMERLKTLQNGDGGFGFWRRGEESWPYVSIHTAHAMQRAKEKGFDIPPDLLQRSQGYLRQIESKYPSYYGPEIRRTLTAYALYVRNRMGDRDAAKARTLISEAGGVEKVPLEALGWLLPVLSSVPSGDANSQTQVAAIRRHLVNRAEETAGTAHFTTSYTDGGHLLLHSNRRADGIILEALIGDDPKNDLIPKIVRGLLAHRVKGRWENTQENSFILLALDRYFNVYEKATPNFVARAWLGDAFAGSHEFRGRTTDSHEINIPMSYLMSQTGQQNLALSKEGAGRLYYRIGMNYAPTSLQLKPYDAGFTVARTYEAVDDPNDVRRQEDGSWRIKAGARVRVRLTMFAQSRRYHVALVDPMPAGFEALNPALAVTGNIPRDEKDTNAQSRWWWWSWQWFEHQNMRDERVEAFTSLLWEGVYNYSYVARATTPGVFVVPPTKAEEMYHPETFGRAASDRVVVE